VSAGAHAYDVDTAVQPVADRPGEAGSATVELTVHVRARSAPGWLACRSTTRFVSGGFHEKDAGRPVASARAAALTARPSIRPLYG